MTTQQEFESTFPDCLVSQQLGDCHQQRREPQLYLQDHNHVPIEVQWNEFDLIIAELERLGAEIDEIINSPQSHMSPLPKKFSWKEEGF